MTEENQKMNKFIKFDGVLSRFDEARLMRRKAEREEMRRLRT